jgi:UDP-N-acetylmuramate dehydrogenase
VIIDVTLRLSKSWQAKLNYAGLKQLSDDASAQAVFEQVIAIRQAKLPDPKQLPNAGSFFKNPIVTAAKYKNLLRVYSNIPAYPQPNGEVKLAAGWLIEQAGLKGYRVGDVGVHDKQALVLVNYANNNTQGKALVELAKHIQTKVLALFDILLEPEVRMLGASGLINPQILLKSKVEGKFGDKLESKEKSN